MAEGYVEQIMAVFNTMRGKVEEFADEVFPIYELLDWKWDGKPVTRHQFISQVHVLINTMSNECMKQVPTKRFYVSAGGICIVLFAPKNDDDLWFGLMNVEVGNTYCY